MAVRQGTRIPFDLSITLAVLDPAAPFSDSCQIVLVNPHGCAARFSRLLALGTVVQLEGLPVLVTVIAIVVNSIPVGQYQKFWLLGLALQRPGNVSGIQNPPGDWE